MMNTTTKKKDAYNKYSEKEVDSKANELIDVDSLD